MFGQAQLCLLLLQVLPLVAHGHLLSPEKVAVERRVAPVCTVTPVEPPGPPPRGFYCGIKGTHTRPAPIQSKKLPNLNACRDLCLNDQPNCISFGYGPGKQCTTFSKNIVDQGLKKSTTGMSYYNRRCFKKTCDCLSGQTLCNNDCVNTQADDNNCGACGTVCSGGSFCVSGTCSCPTGTAFIGGVCQDITIDPRNCGSVGSQCGLGASCRAGVCVCDAPLGLCSGPQGDCSNLDTDSNNCGECGNECDPSASCTAGTCVCPVGQDLCFGLDGPCIDTSFNGINCGSCGNVCPDGGFCSNGECNCQPGSEVCSPNGPCQDLQFDSQNCGACGNACGAGAECFSGQCVCLGETDFCGGTDCVDLGSDNENCGGCGNVCDFGATCGGGQCQCPAGGALCDGPFGPCTNIDSDPDNCGGCGVICEGTCANGQCTCPQGTSLCGGSCLVTSDDNDNCGACGNQCGEGATCVDGQCTCPSGQGLCQGPNGPCSDVSTDAQNCGSCGQVCNAPLFGGEPICYRGVCVECSGDFCGQSTSTPCGNQGNCNCVGIEGSGQYGRCIDVNDGTSCEAFSPRCNTNADCPSDKFCGNYQIACNCQRNACFPKGDRCSNNSFARRIFKLRAAAELEYDPNIIAAKCPGPNCSLEAATA